jgi:maleate cis-trans isomerase
MRTPQQTLVKEFFMTIEVLIVEEIVSTVEVEIPDDFELSARGADEEIIDKALSMFRENPDCVKESCTQYKNAYIV